ncbi:hypothetical protein BDB00DRAFT_867711 [Zychaea mexicana]|uniref:uncharacterized protein n=1 Tax=Zychaea mexicana TaxID=64656 RepID=UPI0022FF36B1|nr:uncharacterized protein BDB00DRAFT_867711 [Zychaea mexicana]KAI9498055.1 hypothetical protein BDB00DRAFT_867711 [Zychaea mexicana]
MKPIFYITPIPQDVHQLMISIFEEVDSHGIKNKLKIGARHMNILSTMSVYLHQDPCIDIGPATSALIDTVRPGRARLFLRRDSIESFMVSFEDKSYMFPPYSISSMRQVSTGFDDASSFAPWRAIIDVLESILTMPATVFTLCDLPHNQGYRVSATSTEKIASRFIKDWDKLAASMTDLKLLIVEHHGLSALTLAMLHDFSSIANLALNRLSDCNTRLKENIKIRLAQLYGDN